MLDVKQVVEKYKKSHPYKEAKKVGNCLYLRGTGTQQKQIQKII